MYDKTSLGVGQNPLEQNPPGQNPLTFALVGQNPHPNKRYLTQSMWQKVQSLGLTAQYKDSEECKVFCGMLDGSAFLPVDSVSKGLDFLKECTPTGFEPLLDYFEVTVVSGQFRRIQPPITYHVNKCIYFVCVFYLSMISDF